MLNGLNNAKYNKLLNAIECPYYSERYCKTKEQVKLIIKE